MQFFSSIVGYLTNLFVLLMLCSLDATNILSSIMQTRRAVAAAVMVGSSPKRNVVRKVSSVTPSPSRKKIKISSSCHHDIRNELTEVVLSHFNKGSNDGDINTITIGGWCLIDGLVHCSTASDGILLPLIREHGVPSFYLDHLKNVNSTTSQNAANDGYESFRSLCRIVSGQQLAGSAAKSIWRRLLNVVEASEDDTTNLTPERILQYERDIESLRRPAGLSNAKCKTIIAIANVFQDGTLSDGIILGGEATDDVVRNLLLGIKGIGPWSVDMLLLFQCQKSDVLPIGDLAFRNGTRNLWKVKNGKAKGGGLCPKKDREKIEKYHKPFAPYRSLSSYYMYKCSGIKD